MTQFRLYLIFALAAVLGLTACTEEVDVLFCASNGWPANAGPAVDVTTIGEINCFIPNSGVTEEIENLYLNKYEWVKASGMNLVF